MVLSGTYLTYISEHRESEYTKPTYVHVDFFLCLQGYLVLIQQHETPQFLQSRDCLAACMFDHLPPADDLDIKQAYTSMQRFKSGDPI